MKVLHIWYRYSIYHSILSRATYEAKVMDSNHGLDANTASQNNGPNPDPDPFFESRFDPEQTKL
jgi:hypothetical protein